MNFKTILFVLSVFAVISCGDDGSPELTINSPENGATYFPGDAFTISVSITDDVGVSSIRFEGELFADPLVETFAEARMTESIDLTLTLDAATPVGEYDIKIIATDTDSNTDDETITIKVE